MRKEEENYIEILSNLSVRQLKAPVGNRWCDVQKQSKEYYDAVAYMTNSYVFSADAVLDVICNDAGLTSIFRLLALSWIKGMGQQYTEDYRDERAKAAVKYCHMITKMGSFRSIYDRLFKAVYDGNRHSYCRKADTILCVYTRRTMRELHHTLRQSFTGLALSFVIRDANLSKIRAEAEKIGLFQSNLERVQFLMI